MLRSLISCLLFLCVQHLFSQNSEKIRQISFFIGPMYGGSASINIMPTGANDGYRMGRQVGGGLAEIQYLRLSGRKGWFMGAGIGAAQYSPIYHIPTRWYKAGAVNATTQMNSNFGPAAGVGFVSAGLQVGTRSWKKISVQAQTGAGLLGAFSSARHAEAIYFFEELVDTIRVVGQYQSQTRRSITPFLRGSIRIEAQMSEKWSLSLGINSVFTFRKATDGTFVLYQSPENTTPRLTGTYRQAFDHWLLQAGVSRRL